MTARAAFLMCMLAATVARKAAAEPWSVEPRLGLSADYNTNPLLSASEQKSEAHVAALVDMPLRYDADAVAVTLRSSGRLGNSAGYASLASNYLHEDAFATFQNDLGSNALQAGWERDSSLLFLGALANGLGVRRDSAKASDEWTRALTERAQVVLDGSWTETKYDQAAAAVVTDYRYLSYGPTFSYQTSERDTLEVVATEGNYHSLSGQTGSKSNNLQLGFVRQLSERWTLNVTGGYSQSKNTEKFFAGPVFLGQISFNQNGVVYSTTLTRQGEHLTLTAVLSRALQPTGLAYLSQQESAQLNAHYIRSERWDFTLGGAWQDSTNPVVGAKGAAANSGYTLRYLNAQVSANWHWTTQWVLSMHTGRVTQEHGPPTVSSASSGVGVDLTYQFLRSEL